MRVLNLYAGLGGNRKYWEGVEVTAVEINPEIARAYQDMYPNDEVIVGNAHEYLPEHYNKYDFIWSSPPCPSHSQYRYYVGVRAKGFKAIYPDLSLYQEIIFLDNYFSGKWVVENTISYYEPLEIYRRPQILNRHYIWANYFIPKLRLPDTGLRYKSKIGELEEYFNIDLSPYDIKHKRKALRNCVEPRLGEHIFNSRDYYQQMRLF